jgi:hypothetical protein
METCKFCGTEHEPCTETECYCGDQSDPEVRTGSGYNAECFDHWVISKED